MHRFAKQPQLKYILFIGLALLVIAAVGVSFLLKPGDSKETRKETAASDISSVVTSVESVVESSSKETASSKPEPKFIVTSPASRDITVYEDRIIFSGKGDKKHPVTLNGKKLNCDSSGYFTLEKKLKEGDNTFELENNGIKYTYKVRYKYVIISSFSPSGGASYDSGASFAVNVFARKGSEVKALFNGKTITLSQTSHQSDDGKKETDSFVKFAGSFSLPNGNASDKNLGKVSITASLNGRSEKKYSGDIICKKENLPTVAEVIYFTAETFNGNSTDDSSRPTNNYFPKGTVDYVVGKTYNNGKEYLKLRCGRRVYVNKKNMDTEVSVVRQFAAKLPSTNSIGFDSLQVTAKSTKITLDTKWKAPFFLEYLPQSYSNPSTQNYTISSFTAKYIDITFCYANKFSGKIDFGKYNPVFSSYKVIKDGKNYKLRLFLRKTGSFYGWNAEYNSKGQLVFEFLNPVQVKAASNKYGADLKGATVYIDVGHGGVDSGAVGAGKVYEKERNLTLAKKIKKELEKIGAKVILNRSGDSTLRPDQRCMNLINAKPDYCIALHHDSSYSSSPNGFGSFYSTPFSYNASKYVYNATMSKRIYNSSASNNRNRLEWHYFFMARMTVCPVVLTENGFMSSSIDFAGIKSDSVNQKKAEAITQGIAKYFLSIRHGIDESKYITSKDDDKINSSSSAPSSNRPVSSDNKPTSSVAPPISSDPTGKEDENESSKDSNSDTVTSN